MPELFYPIMLGQDALPQGVTLSGWRGPEGSHRWSMGDAARLTITGWPAADGPLYLVLRLTAFAPPGRLPGQTVTINLNGEEEVWRLASPAFILKAIRVPDTADGELALGLSTPEAASPAELGLSPDPDRLGVCVAFIALVNGQFLTRLAQENLKGEFATHAAFTAWQQEHEPALIARQIHDYLAASAREGSKWEFPGFCEVCGQESVFTPGGNESSSETGKFREQLLCRGCGLNNRQRLLFAAMRETLAAHPCIHTRLSL